MRMGILRLLLALMVVLHHSAPLFGYANLSGVIAVRAFFIISGFFITFILHTKYIGKNNSYGLFLSNRFLRIYPIYWFILLVTVLVVHPVVFPVIPNVTLLLRPDYLQLNDNLHQPLVIAQAWTLVLELLFYIIAPVIVRKKKRIVVLLLLSLFIHLWVSHISQTTGIPFTDRFFPGELCYFLLGSLMWFVYKHIHRIRIVQKLNSFVSLLFIALTLTWEYLPIHGQIRWIQFSSSLYLVVLCLALPFLFEWSSTHKLDRQIGELSYPVYLIHLTVMYVLQHSAIGKMNQNALTVGVLVISVILSIMITRIIQKPIDSWRQARIH